MKASKTAAIFAAVVVLLVSSPIWYLGSTPTQWPTRDYPNSRVEFFNNEMGVIIGPRVLHTQNGGKAWSIIDYVNPSDSFNPKIVPIMPSISWISSTLNGRGGLVRETPKHWNIALEQPTPKAFANFSPGLKRSDNPGSYSQSRTNAESVRPVQYKPFQG